MPTVVLEAMAHALPIIVTDVGATAELVSSSNGYLIKKNNVAELKKAFASFIDLSDSQKKKLGQNSLKKVHNHFTWPKVAKKHYQLFKSLTEDLGA